MTARSLASSSTRKAHWRVEEDADGDGRPDKWETYENGVLATAAFDHPYGVPTERSTIDRK
jgi:hypothetical protein